MKIHANIKCSCSTYLGGCYGLDWKFDGVKKKVTTKRYDIVYIELAGYLLCQNQTNKQVQPYNSICMNRPTKLIYPVHR